MLDISQNRSQATLIYSPEAGLANDFLLYVNSSGRIEAMFEDALFVSGSPGAVPVNKWTHVAFILYEGVGRFYFNGNSDSNRYYNHTYLTS